MDFGILEVFPHLRYSSIVKTNECESLDCKIMILVISFDPKLLCQSFLLVPSTNKKGLRSVGR